MTKYYWAVWPDHQDEEPFVIEEAGDSGYFAPGDSSLYDSECFVILAPVEPYKP